MAIKKKMCVNHPERPAIGECVITARPICSECTTRYEGVNYSKEGLEMLRQRRAAEARRSSGGERLAAALLALGSPLFLYLLYWFYLLSFEAAIDLLQLEWRDVFQGL